MSVITQAKNRKYLENVTNLKYIWDRRKWYINTYLATKKTKRAKDIYE